MIDRGDLPSAYEAISLRTPTLPPATHTNCYAVGRREALILDPGSPFPPEICRLKTFLDERRGLGRQLPGGL